MGGQKMFLFYFCLMNIGDSRSIKFKGIHIMKFYTKDGLIMSFVIGNYVVGIFLVKSLTEG